MLLLLQLHPQEAPLAPGPLDDACAQRLHLKFSRACSPFYVAAVLTNQALGVQAPAAGASGQHIQLSALAQDLVEAAVAIAPLPNDLVQEHILLAAPQPI